MVANVLRRIALLVVVCSVGACGQLPDHLDDGFAVYSGGESVALERAQAEPLRERFAAFFYECAGTYEDVTGGESPDLDPAELWRSLEGGTYAMLTVPAFADAPFGELRDRDFTVLFGLDPETGVGPVLARHGDVVASYIKCPGLEAMILTCDLLRTIPGDESWPVCGRVEEYRSMDGRLNDRG